MHDRFISVTKIFKRVCIKTAYI